MGFGPKVRERRTALGFSQEHLAHQAGLSWAAVQRLEAGTIVDPHYSTLHSIAHALGTTVAELVGEKELAVPLADASETGPESDYAVVLQQMLENALEAAQPIVEQDDQSIAAYRQALARMKGGVGVSDALFAEAKPDLSPEVAEIVDLVLEQEQRRRALARPGAL